MYGGGVGGFRPLPEGIASYIYREAHLSVTGKRLPSASVQHRRPPFGARSETRLYPGPGPARDSSISGTVACLGPGSARVGPVFTGVTVEPRLHPGRGCDRAGGVSQPRISEGNGCTRT